MKYKEFVVHINKSPYDVYVGRPSKFGNPFVTGVHGTRSEVILKYEEYVLSNPTLLEAVKTELRGKVLACWCGPTESCHADILAKIANTEYEMDLSNL